MGLSVPNCILDDIMQFENFPERSLITSKSPVAMTLSLAISLTRVKLVSSMVGFSVLRRRSAMR